MRTRGLLAIAIPAAVLVAALAWHWRGDGGVAKGDALLVPTLAARLEQLDKIELRGAGDAVLVTLDRVDGRWRVAQRGGWPADEGALGRSLFEFSQARRSEAKTADPARHERLGVEDIAAADAQGVELFLQGGGAPLRILLGDVHPRLNASYVRVNGEAQAWLSDRNLDLEREPAKWLDRRLVDMPLARLDRVAVAPAGGRAFVLSRVEDRFSLDGQPPAALADPDRGNATAGFLDQLQFDDVASDPGTAAAQVAEFVGLDGVDVVIEAWRQDEQTWARCRVALDESRARAWLAQGGAGDVDARLATLRGQADEWRSRCAGHAFQLPAYKAANLMRSREQYLAD